MLYSLLDLVSILRFDFLHKFLNNRKKREYLRNNRFFYFFIVLQFKQIVETYNNYLILILPFFRHSKILKTFYIFLKVIYVYI